MNYYTEEELAKAKLSELETLVEEAKGTLAARNNDESGAINRRVAAEKYLARLLTEIKKRLERMVK